MLSGVWFLNAQFFKSHTFSLLRRFSGKSVKSELGFKKKKFSLSFYLFYISLLYKIGGMPL